MKTKLLVSGKKNEALAASGQCPCAVCNRGVSVNSILCSRDDKWCHGRCTGLSSSNGINIGTYFCPVCSGTLQKPVQSDESIALGRGTIDEVNEFCFLGEMLDYEGAERVV